MARRASARGRSAARTRSTRQRARARRARRERAERAGSAASGSSAAASTSASSAVDAPSGAASASAASSGRQRRRAGGDCRASGAAIGAADRSSGDNAAAAAASVRTRRDPASPARRDRDWHARDGDRRWRRRRPRRRPARWDRDGRDRDGDRDAIATAINRWCEQHGAATAATTGAAIATATARCSGSAVITIPIGWGYRRFSIGFSLCPSYYDSNYWLNDPWQYRLPPAYGPYRWVRYYDDALLVNIYTGAGGRRDPQLLLVEPATAVGRRGVAGLPRRPFCVYGNDHA